MRPGTVHFVLTVENSITDGRHGYAASTMAESAYAIIHTFVLDPFITNTTHYATQKLWRRIFKFWMISFQSEYPGIFWFLSVFLPVSLTCLLVSESCRAHVPDPGTWQGVCDILAVINIIQLSGVLDCRTYTEGLPLEERSEPYAARRVCQDFADFFSSSYGVKRDGKLLLAWEDLFEVSTTQVLPLPMLRNLSTRPRFCRWLLHSHFTRSGLTNSSRHLVLLWLCRRKSRPSWVRFPQSSLLSIPPWSLREKQRKLSGWCLGMMAGNMRL